MSIIHIPTQSDVPSTGRWGPATSVHQFCEPKYATSPYFAEFYNSLSFFRKNGHVTMRSVAQAAPIAPVSHRITAR